MSVAWCIGARVSEVLRGGGGAEVSDQEYGRDVGVDHVDVGVDHVDVGVDVMCEVWTNWTADTSLSVGVTSL